MSVYTLLVYSVQVKIRHKLFRSRGSSIDSSGFTCAHGLSSGCLASEAGQVQLVFSTSSKFRLGIPCFFVVKAFPGFLSLLLDKAFPILQLPCTSSICRSWLSFCHDTIGQAQTVLQSRRSWF